MVDLNQLKRQLENIKSVSAELTNILSNVDTTIVELQDRLKPVTEMNNTVGLCKTNINAAITKLKLTCETLS